MPNLFERRVTEFMTLHFHMNLFLLALNHNHCEKDVLKIFAKFTGNHLCQSLFSNKSAGLCYSTLLKKETLAKVFSCEFCDTFFNRTSPVAASFK